MPGELRFPHCDPRILHAPGECKFCDESGLQAVRKYWNIAFTGQPPEKGLTPCPAGVVRSSESLNHWHGNRPQTEADIRRADAEMEEFTNELLRKFGLGENKNGR